MSIVKMLLFIAVAICTLAGCASVKVTDPKDPRFGSQEFRFENYANNNARYFRPAMEALFPLGTQRKEIERLLVTVGGAKIYGENPDSRQRRQLLDNERIVRYAKRYQASLLTCRFLVVAIYDDADILSREIDASHGCK